MNNLFKVLISLVYLMFFSFSFPSWCEKLSGTKENLLYESSGVYYKKNTLTPFTGSITGPGRANNFKNGKYHGPQFIFHIIGKMRGKIKVKERYKNGIKDGLFYFQYQDGKLDKLSYKNGLLVYILEYDKDGNLVKEFILEKEKKNKNNKVEKIVNNKTITSKSDLEVCNSALRRGDKYKIKEALRRAYVKEVKRRGISCGITKAVGVTYRTISENRDFKIGKCIALVSVATARNMWNVKETSKEVRSLMRKNGYRTKATVSSLKKCQPAKNSVTEIAVKNTYKCLAKFSSKKDAYFGAGVTESLIVANLPVVNTRAKMALTIGSYCILALN